MSNKKIGVFDSGFGGLTILSELRSLLSEYDYVYFGDSANAPYGSKTQAEILNLTKKAVDFLFENDCEIIIVACNSASAEALRAIQQDYLPNKYPKKRVLGIIIPAAEWVFEKHAPKRIGVIGTKSTVDSGAYLREIAKINSVAEVQQIACPKLVPLIESGEIGLELELALSNYLSGFHEIDTLILGCTHYGYIENKIQAILPNIQIINQSHIVAEKFVDYLKRHPEIESKLSKSSTTFYFTSGSTVDFDTIGQNLLGETINSISL